jgi:16S rRNA (guanine527-N7)-methyltransferase
MPDFLTDQAAQFGVLLTAEQRAQMETYQTLLQEWNERMNLTGITDPQEVLVRHFLDALSCAQVTGSLDGRRLIDIGTGAGFPGLPLKIAYPTLRLTLVDSVAKKTEFLAAVVSALNLANVTILSDRAELLGQHKAHRQQYDWAVARSVAEMRILAEYLLPLVRVGGQMLAQKGSNAAEETAAAHAAIRTLGGGTPTLHPIHLPGHEQTHYLVAIPKQRPTPTGYPRRIGLPKQRPIE